MADTKRLTLTDEQILAVPGEESQEFADLSQADKFRFYQLQNRALRDKAAKAEEYEKKQKGYGMEASISNGRLLISLPIVPKQSSTGKALVIASTRGNAESKLQHNGKTVIIGVNAYVLNE